MLLSTHPPPADVQDPSQHQFVPPWKSPVPHGSPNPGKKQEGKDSPIYHPEEDAARTGLVAERVSRDDPVGMLGVIPLQIDDLQVGLADPQVPGGAGHLEGRGDRGENTHRVTDLALLRPPRAGPRPKIPAQTRPKWITKGFIPKTLSQAGFSAGAALVGSESCGILQ